MIELKPDCLYTRDDLKAMLEPAGVDPDAFVARIKPRKVFRQVWLGSDLLTALRKAPTLAATPSSGMAPSTSTPKRRSARPRKAASPSDLAPAHPIIAAYRAELKGVGGNGA